MQDASSCSDNTQIKDDGVLAPPHEFNGSTYALVKQVMYLILTASKLSSLTQLDKFFPSHGSCLSSKLENDYKSNFIIFWQIY
jgi:hypothetical protein